MLDFILTFLFKAVLSFNTENKQPSIKHEVICDTQHLSVEVLKNAATFQYIGLTLGGAIALLNSTIIIRLAATNTISFQTSFSGSGLAMDTVGSFIKIRRIE
jgi:uncharacterized membrane protein YdcZ (DUF606 family)